MATQISGIKVLPIGKEPPTNEIRSINIDSDDRYIVSFVVGYSDRRVSSPEEAAAAALAMTLDKDSNDTVWFVFDRYSESMVAMQQSQFNEILYEKGFIS